MTRRTTKPRAFMAADVILAIIIVAILTVALASATSRQQHASQRLAESRAAARLAEATMIALQTGLQPPTPQANAKVTVKSLEKSDDLPVGSTWATISVTLSGRPYELTGIIRADAPKAEAP